MRNFLFLVFFITSFNVSSEETISRWMSDYFKRIHGHIADENYDKALHELELGVTNYFRNGRTYEAALCINFTGNSMQFKVNIQKPYLGLKKH